MVCSIIKNYVIVPLSTRDTIASIKRQLRDKNIISFSLLGYRMDKFMLDNVFKKINSTNKFRSIFTSKTAVKIVWKYVKDKKNLASKIFQNSIAIGPQTALKILRLTQNLQCSYVELPKRHNSKGIAEILKENENYILWCSKGVDKSLAKIIAARNGVVASIYEVRVKSENLKLLHNALISYPTRYIIFTSLSSKDVWLHYKKRFRHVNGDLYAIAISKRVANQIGSFNFKYIYTYDSTNISNFYDFIKEVVER
jgi:uroporphyrinogen-III synthase